MPSYDDIDLLVPSVDVILRSVSDRERTVYAHLETEASSDLVNGLRMARLQRAIVAVGIFSLFESLLQHEMGWTKPFESLDARLKSHRAAHLAATIRDYRLAINVLKHGTGESYRALCRRADRLEFKVKSEGESFFVEGDVGEGQSLIDVDDRFVDRCAALVVESLGVIRRLNG